MLARKYRLPAHITFAHATIVRENEYVCKFQPNGLTFPRFGFIVSKAIDKRAVVRNRLKRVVRSFVEKELSGLKGYDALFIFRPAVKDATKKLLQEKVSGILVQLAT